MNFADARENMVESQVRPNGITDSRIIEAMLELAREDFVPAEKRDIAYMDEDIPLTTPAGGGPERVLIEPMAFARLVQLARIGAGDNVLHVGAATGYGTAVLALLGGKVTALEENTDLAELARHNLGRFDNVTVATGALAQGHRAAAPYDVILIEGLVGEVPEAILAQLKDGGRLITVIGNGIVAKAVTITKNGQTLSERRGFDATVGELPGFAARKPEFVF
jgi:protein-L-isoaspartate(D-aspartate) O-methyltransferase